MATEMLQRYKKLQFERGESASPAAAAAAPFEVSASVLSKQWRQLPACFTIDYQRGFSAQQPKLVGSPRLRLR